MLAEIPELALALANLIHSSFHALKAVAKVFSNLSGLSWDLQILFYIVGILILAHVLDTIVRIFNSVWMIIKAIGMVFRLITGAVTVVYRVMAWMFMRSPGNRRETVHGRISMALASSFQPKLII